jgi:hypothetical protein
MKRLAILFIVLLQTAMAWPMGSTAAGFAGTGIIAQLPSKSRSRIRSRMHSINRKPPPYIILAIKR